MYIHSFIHTTNIYGVPIFLGAGNQCNVKQSLHSDNAQIIRWNLQQLRTCVFILQMRKLKLHSTDEKIEDFTEIVWGHRDRKSTRKDVWKLIADPFLRLTSQLRPVCWALLPWRSSGCLQRPTGVEIRGWKLGDSSAKVLSSRYFITRDTPSLPAAYNNKRNQTWSHIYVSK